MSFYRGQASFMAGSDLPIGVNDNIDQVQEERKTPGGDLKTPEQGPSSATPAINNDRLSSMRTSSVRHPSTRASPPAFRNGRDETADSLWLPHETVTEDRCKANIAWAALLSGAVVWLVGVVASVRGRRANPPVRITEKVEPFGFPDVAICPTSGAGCDSGDPSLCLEGMQLIVSDLAGFEEEAGDFTATLDSAVSIASAAAAAAAVAAPQPGLTAMLDPVAHSWCPVLPLSELTIDRDGIDSGEVQSLHASVYVLWSDEVAETPLSSTRQFINTFFLVDGDLGGAVLSRLPYDRVSINGTDPSTFVANDVTVGLTEHVPLGADEDAVERVHTQVATIGQQTLTIDGGPDEPFAGAIMFATFSINDFSFQSVEEYDPVDYWRLVGAGGGILAILYALFGLLFVSTRSEGPRRMWRFSRRRRRRRSRLDLRTIPAEDGAAAASAAAGKPPIRASI